MPVRSDPSKWPRDISPDRHGVVERTIDGFDIRDAIFQQPERLTIHGITQPIGDETLDVFLHQRRIFARQARQAHGGLCGGVVGFVASNDFKKPGQMTRLGPVHPDESLWILPTLLQQCDRQRGCVAGDRCARSTAASISSNTRFLMARSSTTLSITNVQSASCEMRFGIDQSLPPLCAGI